MKAIILSLIFICSGIALGKKAVNLKSFNKAVGENISEVMNENPHLYETKPINRAPASLSEKSSNLNSTDKLDEVEEQADTHISW